MQHLRLFFFPPYAFAAAKILLGKLIVEFRADSSALPLNHLLVIHFRLPCVTINSRGFGACETWNTKPQSSDFIWE